MKYNAVLDKSKAFALKIIKFCDFLVEKKRLYTLSNQLYESNNITKEQFDYMYKDCDEIIALLVSITKTQKTKSTKKQECLEIDIQ